MLLSNRFAIILFGLASASNALAANAVCPVRQNQPLRYVDVFDGEPTELMFLEADVAKAHSGYWSLGYIYDKGRFVTIRCKYADKQTQDVRLIKRVERCNYAINTKDILRVTCK
jgi:hypothetical protein